jgi:hypothetical protein
VARNHHFENFVVAECRKIAKLRNFKAPSRKDRPMLPNFLYLFHNIAKSDKKRCQKEKRCSTWASIGLALWPAIRLDAE